MVTSPLLILGILCLNIALSEWLCRYTFFRHLGTALMVIVVTAIAANIGLIPTTSANVPIYDWLTGDVVSLAVFWILLQVNLRELLKAGAPMISLFLIGSLGTLLGAIVGMLCVNGATTFGGEHIGLAAMFTGTYTGGSVNFNAMALEYDVAKSSILFAGAVVVDNIMTTIWMVVTIAIPRGIGFIRKNRLPIDSLREQPKEVITGEEQDTESLHPLDIALLVALGAAAVSLSQFLADWSAAHFVRIPSMLFLTVFALVLAQLPIVTKMRGTRTLGMFAVYLFLAVIGAMCDFEQLQSLNEGVRLTIFVAIVVLVHGIVCFGAGAIFKVDRDIVAVASQANIGGGTSALAVARSLGRGDLVLPAILVGSLGTGLGNFLGILAASIMSWLQPVAS